VITGVLQTTGWLVAHVPEPALRVLASGLGRLIFAALPRRRRIALSNLAHAFPDRDPAWARRMARESCIRLAETALLSLASPHLSPERLRRIATDDGSVEAFLADRAARPRPTVLASPHLAYWEAQTWIGLLCRAPLGEFAAIYRPLDNPKLDTYVRRSRERAGMRLLSRKEGFAEALRLLRRNGCVGVLFDQNAGLQGALTTLFGRVCSTTELLGVMAERFAADVRIIQARRLGFWRIQLSVEALPPTTTAAETTVGLNRWLEARLNRDDDLCASWLWSHDRWRNQDIPARRFRLEAKRNFLAEEQRLRGWIALPRRTRVFVRLPNWLGDVVMAAPLLRALHASRPDAALTLVGRGAYEPLLRRLLGPDVAYVPLPRRGWGYWGTFLRLRATYPDVYLLFTHSARSDIEARLTGCRQRFGLVPPGRRRPLLTHRYRPSPEEDPRTVHQLTVWEGFLKAFGLDAPTDLRPLSPPRGAAGSPRVVGLIAGSENAPEKRWPVDGWRSLIAGRSDLRFRLFGTAGDRPITARIAAGFPGDRVSDEAGRTDLVALLAAFADCDLVVANDTGGMHLANAAGVPVIALFGPTNPCRTRPVFSSPLRILQPPGCPATGGAPLADLRPEAVLEAVRDLLAPSPDVN
jgi:heptosyltransferase II